MFIDLNCDMGESFGDYCLGCDDQVIAHITSANLACGFHASDPITMDKTIRLCAEHGVAIGAHPGYPDLRGFGRRNLASTPEEVRGDVLYQVGALAGLARARGVELQHVKPHGAMYNTAASHPPTAKAIATAVAEYDPGLILVTLAGPGGEIFRTIAQETGLKVASEAFADRAYTAEGRLAPRGTAGAVVHDPEVVAARCVRMATEGVVEAIDGTLVKLQADTICVHGDTPSAVELVKAVNQAMATNGVELQTMGRTL
ncbi:MAG: LamB/YcsF family protein [Desulfarculaceae bacterium]|nr:LamB/YcsF family protein [Desulfarculaceae bacterium]MCF8071624.1 LamB/YcsF family protein [Desulfarculaceae bacterium]MCF8103179.1 LamB/YcsF family protein [Desulfarculaceae bacterium]MCF8114903.1 LamB/YcsF family protein [Desulfarculaceae bacterium]